jgi:hypothetical protein
VRVSAFIFAPLFLLFLTAPVLYGQTADAMDAVLGEPAVSYARAAQFVLAGAGVLSGDADTAGAFDYAKANGWLPKNARGENSINMGELSLLIMKAFDIRGGFMYALLPSGHYAYRAMVRRGIIQGFGDPHLKISGERFLLILGKALSYTGDSL